MVLGLFDSAIPFKGQVYSKLKSQCVSSGTLFQDPEFPPDSSSLFYTKSAPSNIVWKRPGEITGDPKFFVDGASTDDFHQGSLGNCWFVAAAACIAEKPKLLKQIVPDIEKQEWLPENKNKYAGIFHFRFWVLGEWTDVVVDDYLPTQNGNLIYIHSNTRNEFWSALLEKAYAKIYGSYEVLEGGHAKDALVDMTGGVGEDITVSNYTESEEKKQKLFNILSSAISNRSLISASINAKDGEMEDKTKTGLVKGHAYSVTDVRKIKLGQGLLAFFKRESMEMVRCRNPWGGTEWTGAWSDGSEEWAKVSDSEKKELGITIEDNGEFWMSFEDFCKNFTSIDLCHLINTSFFSLSKTWHEGVGKGEWTDSRCGGSFGNEDYLKNPQYVFDVNDKEDEVLVSLQQADTRAFKGEEGKEMYGIGFFITKTDLNREYRMHDKLETAHCSGYAVSRDVMERATLKRGRYVIFPTTHKPDQKTKYILRMYFSSSPDFKELCFDEPQPPQCCSFLCKPPTAATQITINSADNLESTAPLLDPDPYCEIFCEGNKVKTSVCKSTKNPNWNERITFYQKKDGDIKIEIWNDNLIKDDFLGQCVIPLKEKSKYTGKTIQFPLLGKGKEESTKQKGTISVTILHTKEMDTV
ncbi:calpain-5-like [Saccostrea echinata]|uniref:calpain-5-like n=1 Tax=Saccostrea echinata TaxID=191078 RepID=UPI002A814F5D|nr:calpain-5-like [Saccostrea echinata]